jgi:hypothetical protein
VVYTRAHLAAKGWINGGARKEPLLKTSAGAGVEQIQGGSAAADTPAVSSPSPIPTNQSKQHLNLQGDTDSDRDGDDDLVVE